MRRGTGTGKDEAEEQEEYEQEQEVQGEEGKEQEQNGEGLSTQRIYTSLKKIIVLITGKKKCSLGNNK